MDVYRVLHSVQYFRSAWNHLRGNSEDETGEYKDLVFKRTVEPAAAQLGNTLREARCRHGLTQQSLAARVGLTLQAVAHYEAAHVPPPLRP